MVDLNDIRNAVSARLPSNWGFSVYPCSEIDNPTELADGRIYALAFDATGVAVDVPGSEWLMFRFHQIDHDHLGTVLFVWGDTVRVACSPAELDRLVVDVVEAACRRLATLET
jgi:hypothetical protein